MNSVPWNIAAMLEHVWDVTYFYFGKNEKGVFVSFIHFDWFEDESKELNGSSPFELIFLEESHLLKFDMNSRLHSHLFKPRYLKHYRPFFTPTSSCHERRTPIGKVVLEVALEEDTAESLEVTLFRLEQSEFVNL